MTRCIRHCLVAVSGNVLGVLGAVVLAILLVIGPATASTSSPTDELASGAVGQD